MGTRPSPVTFLLKIKVSLCPQYSRTSQDPCHTRGTSASPLSPAGAHLSWQGFRERTGRRAPCAVSRVWDAQACAAYPRQPPAAPRDLPTSSAVGQAPAPRPCWGLRFARAAGDLSEHWLRDPGRNSSPILQSHQRELTSRRQPGSSPLRSDRILRRLPAPAPPRPATATVRTGRTQRRPPVQRPRLGGPE